MISIQKFDAIVHEVVAALNESFDFVKNNCSDQKYILLLADADFISRYASNPRVGSGYVLESREDIYKDRSRINFFTQFMDSFYSFPASAPQTTDDQYKITMELMMYTHIWESKPFLKQLYRLACLVDKQPYPWIVEVPPMSKHDFIRNNIRDVLKRQKMKLADIICPKGFHTSLRNAFAHSEYEIREDMQFIHLDTYNGKPWDIENLAFDKWTEMFAYSTLLSYHYLRIKYERRESIVKDFGKDEFFIMYPSNKHQSRLMKVGYDARFKNFFFVK